MSKWLKLMKKDRRDEIDRFVANACVLDADAFNKREEVWAAFDRWLGPKSWWRLDFLHTKQFGDALRLHGVRRETKTKRGGPERYYSGIRLLQVEDIL